MTRRLATLGAIALILLAFPLVALAHPDGPGATGRHVVGANAFLALPLRIHYHRLVGEFRVTDPPGAQVALLLTDLDGALGLVPGKREGVAFVGESSASKLNHLIPCCAGETWSDRFLVIENRGTAPATVVLDTTLVHDDLGVTVLDGEPGAIPGVLTAFAVIAALMATALVPHLRSRSGSQARGDERLLRVDEPLLRVSASLFAVATVPAVALALIGIAKYGGGPIDGLVASVAAVPFPPGPFGSRFSIPYAAVFFLWAAGLVTWARALARADGATRRPAAGLGLAVGLATIVVATLVGATYATALVPLAGALLLGGPPGIAGTVALLGRWPPPAGVAEGPALAGVPEGHDLGAAPAAEQQRAGDDAGDEHEGVARDPHEVR